ncbi:MAG: PAS domain-containing sensor histidine kinase [Gemmatimonadota bacterium]
MGRTADAPLAGLLAGQSHVHEAVPKGAAGGAGTRMPYIWRLLRGWSKFTAFHQDADAAPGSAGGAPHRARSIALERIFHPPPMSGTAPELESDDLGVVDASYRSLVRAAPLALYLLDPEGVVRLWNPAAEQLFGWSEQDVVGGPDPTVTRDGEGLASLLANAGPALEIVEREVVRRRRDGSDIDIALSAGRVCDRHGRTQAIVVLAADISARRRREEERGELLERERHAVHARERLLAVVSHDLRNSLATVLLNASAIIESPNPGAVDPSVRDQLQWIARSAEQMNRLISDLLDVSAIELGRFSLDPSPHSVRKIVRDAAEMYRPLTAEKGIGFTWEGASDLPDVRVDAGRIQQVLGNLLANAVKFSPPESSVVLRAEMHSPMEVRFSVQDTGPGIAPDHLPEVFELYWQGDRGRRAGAGLGLGIAKAIVEAHGGRIWAASELGRGSTVSFTVPIISPSVDADHILRE